MSRDSGSGELPGCPVCGSEEGYIITMLVPVYVSVDLSGAIHRVRVDDEASSVQGRDMTGAGVTGGAGGGGAGGTYTYTTVVTCRGDDHLITGDLAQAVRDVADYGGGDWPRWELGA